MSMFNRDYARIETLITAALAVLEVYYVVEIEGREVLASRDPEAIVAGLRLLDPAPGSVIMIRAERSIQRYTPFPYTVARHARSHLLARYPMPRYVLTFHMEALKARLL
jgi:hypothetical protein